MTADEIDEQPDSSIEEVVEEEEEELVEEKKPKKKKKRKEDKDAIKFAFPLRLGVFTVLFVTFFIIAGLALYILEIIPFFTGGVDPLGGSDLFETLVMLLRFPTTLPGISFVYNLIIPADLVNREGLEVIYISTSLILTFLTVSIISGHSKIRHFIFRGGRIKIVVVQILIFLLFFALFLHLFNLIYIISEEIFFVSGFVEYLSIIIIVIAEITWLFIQTWSLLSWSRSAATSMENSFSARKSRIIYGFALITPILCLIGILIISVGFYLVAWFGELFNIIGKLFGILDLTTITIITAFFMVLFCLIPFCLTVFGSRQKRRAHTLTCHGCSVVVSPGRNPFAGDVACPL